MLALPSFGKSNTMDSYDSIEYISKAILQLLEKKGIKSFNLLGYSMGGMIVLEIAKLVGENF